MKVHKVFAAIACTVVTTFLPLAAFSQQPIPMIQAGLPGAQHELFINTLDLLLIKTQPDFAQVMTTQDKVRHGLWVCQRLNQGATIAQVQQEIAADTQISPDPVIPELAQVYASDVIRAADQVYCSPK